MGPNTLLGICLGVLALALPRRCAFGAVLAAGTYTTYGDALDLGGLSFYSIRIVIVFTLVRVIARSDLNGIRFQAFDALFAAWLIVTNLLYVTFDGSYVALSEQLGYLGDAGGLYVIVRALVRNADDLAETVVILGLLLMPLAVLFAIERVTGRNLFAVLGGVRSWSHCSRRKGACPGSVQAPDPCGNVCSDRFSSVSGTFSFPARPQDPGGGRRIVRGRHRRRIQFERTSQRLRHMHHRARNVVDPGVHALRALGRARRRDHVVDGDEGAGVVCDLPAQRSDRRRWLVPFAIDR